jgi:hypothetical protein
MLPQLPPLDELLKQHRAEIDSLSKLLQDVLGPEYDDIWLLRYILSFKSAKEAEEACRFCIEWRKKYKDDLQLIESGQDHPLKKTFNQFQVVSEHKYTTDGEPLYYVRIGLCNTKALMDAMPYEDVLVYMTLSRAKQLKYCDEMTRKEGRLVKVISVLDLQGFSPTRGNDSRFQRVLGEGSKLSERLFPQLLGISVMVNSSKVFIIAFNVIKHIMSKKTVEKTRFCPGKNSGKGVEHCPFLSKHMRVEDIPTFLGGQCNCLPGCIAGIPNSQTSPLNEVTSDGCSSITVGARSSENIEIPVGSGSRVVYAVSVQDKDISVSISFANALHKETKDIVSKRLLSSKDDAVEGKYLAEAEGVISLLLDNTKSLLKSKTVKYKLEYEMETQ